MDGAFLLRDLGGGVRDGDAPFVFVGLTSERVSIEN